MDFLRTEADAGRLQGISPSPSLRLSSRLFADDLGMFIPATEIAFEQARIALGCYEMATGALLNLAKSKVIPFALDEPPAWLQNMGCTISEPGEVLRYLGAPFGCELLVSQMHIFCLDKIGARLSSWSTRFLSFAGRVLLIKHVLQAIPIYHMMLLKSSDGLARKIIALSRGFLWGQNVNGGKRIPLVAWDKLARPKLEGGLGLKDFRSHSDALLSKWFTGALDNPSSEWAQMYAVNLGLTKWRNYKMVCRNKYSMIDKMLLSLPRSFGKLVYIGQLWSAWERVQENLIFCPGTTTIPGHWSVEDLL